MISTDFVATCILLAMEHSQGLTISPTDIDFLGLSLDDDTASSTSSFSSPLYAVCKTEAVSYYSGLCSSPRLVYRTGSTPFMVLTGPEAYPPLKELRPVFGHKLNVIWKELGPKVCQLLDSQGVLWTSIDVVRFIRVGEGKGNTVGPVVLWIGVAPETLFGEDAHTSANGCLDLLKEFGIIDVEVEYRESIYTQSAGPTLLEPVVDLDPTVDVRGPLTPVLGLSIAAQATPHAEGTGGIYLAEGGDSKKVLLVTARHVLFPPNYGLNVDYARTDTSAPRRDVLLLGTKAYDNLLKSIEIKAEGHGNLVKRYGRKIENLRARVAGEDEVDVKEATWLLEKSQSLLDESREAIKALEKFHGEVKKEWRLSQRVLGHIVRSPPISFSAGAEGFTEDYAVVELDRSRISDKEAFKGNVIDLCAF